MKIALFFELSIKDVLYFNPTVQNLYDKLYEYFENLSDFNKIHSVMTDITDGNGEVISAKKLNIEHDTYIRVMNYLSNFEMIVRYTKFDFENIMPVLVSENDRIRYKVVGEINFEEVIDDIQHLD